MDAVSLFHRLTRRPTTSAPAPNEVAPDQPSPPVADAAKLHAWTAPADDRAYLDDITWDDMLLPQFLARLSGGVSLFGQQFLYRQLRRGVDVGSRADLRARQERLDQDAAACAAVSAVCQPLQQSGTDVAELLFGNTPPPMPRWAGYAWLLTAALLASLAAVALTPWAWVPVFIVLYQLITLQLRYQPAMDHAALQRRSLQMLLRSCSLAAATPHAAQSQLAPLAVLGKRAGRLNRALSASAMASVPVVSAYLDWFMLRNVEHYFKTSRIIAEQRNFLRTCYDCCAELEATLALVRYRASLARWCWVQEGEGIALDDAVHPLLEQAAPLSIDTTAGGVFLSGQNGIGKSTLLRTVGLNLVIARAFGFAHARRASVTMLPVYSSMQSEDSLLAGDSLYIAELKRARELLAVASAGQGAVFLIDEIFRGTNHHESVAAAAAVLDELAGANLVMVSSHNLILAQLLAHCLAPRCIVRDAEGALRLVPGVLAETNGVALLAARGFDDRVVAKARRVAAWLERQSSQAPAAAAAAMLRPLGGEAA